MGVNDRLMDAGISHGVNMIRLSNWIATRMIGLLNKVDSDLLAQLNRALEQMTPSSFNVERLEGLLESVRVINKQAYQALERELTAELQKLGAYEAGYQKRLFESSIPAQIQARVPVNAVSLIQIDAAIRSRPFQGRLLREWVGSLEEGRATRLRDAVRIGYTENQTIDQIVRRVRGTRARAYSDGILQVDRRNAEAIVRTAVSHTAGTARETFYRSNDDLVKGEVWVATLDLRTTEECQIRDGLEYDNDHKPIGHSIPWLSGPGRLHWGCRSTSVPILKSWRELGIPIDEISPSTRASMDGQVPQETSYPEWLKAQSAERQDEVLGPTRGALLREGKIEFKDMYDAKGQFLTLEEMEKRDRI
jgi:hypothetical protein